MKSKSKKKKEEQKRFDTWAKGNGDAISQK